MTIYPTMKTGGGNIELAVESALGTPGSYYDWRQCDDADPTFPTDTRETLAVSSKGYRDPTKREPQITFEKAIEGGIGVASYVAGCPTTSVQQVATLLKSMGCAEIGTAPTATNAYGNLDGYTSVTAFTIAAPVAGTNTPTLAVGQAAALNLVNGNLWPFLCAANSGTAAYDITPTMGISSASAATVTDYWYPMRTLVPPKGLQVPSTQTLAWRVSSHFVTSTETGSNWLYTGCAAAEVKDVTFEPGLPVKFDFSVHCAKRSFDQGGIDLSADTYTDTIAIPITDGGSRFECGFADVAAMPITRATLGMRKAVWKPGIKVIPVVETGSASSLNGWGGFLGYSTGSTITITADVNKEWWTALEASGASTAKYLELVQPTTLTSSPTTSANPCWGLWMPNCYLTGKPSADLWGEKEMTVTYTLMASAATISATSKTDAGSYPWYFAMNHTSGF